MIQRLFSLPALLLLTMIAAPMTAGAKKKSHNTFHLNVHFVIGSADGKTEKLTEWLDTVVGHAERLFNTKPKLKIKYTTEVRKKAGGKNLDNLQFKNSREIAGFMDKHFDHVAERKTKGHLTVLVSDDICYETRVEGKKVNKCIGGRAYFPHWMVFNRYHGILIKANGNEYTFAHEIGHFLGLKHTFERYLNINPKMNCNTEYRPLGVDEGKCASCKGTVTSDEKCTGKANLMDYCGKSSEGEYLNSCQRKRAAKQRKKYMTRDGKTNYNKIKGLLGKPNCKADSDCETGHYCWKGVAGVGRNQCRAKRGHKKACTKDKHCTSDRCVLFKCAKPKKKKKKRTKKRKKKSSGRLGK
ncbi:MAG: Dickkopf N-terminal cysteine-rich domain-containing protein [Bradymonadia bacterium]